MSKRPNDQWKPTRVSKHGGACRNRNTVRSARLWHRRRAAAGDDEDQAGPRPEHVPGAAVHRRRSPASEGFTDVQLRRRQDGVKRHRRAPGLRRSRHQPAFCRAAICSASKPATRLSFWRGCHVGCFELFANRAGRASVSDLKGKTVGVTRLGDRGQHVFLASIMSYVGLRPAQGHQVGHLSTGRSRCGSSPKDKIDAYHRLSARTRRSCGQRRSGRSIVNSAADRPWSQYFCCMLAGNREFVRNNRWRPSGRCERF